MTLTERSPTSHDLQPSLLDVEDETPKALLADEYSALRTMNTIGEDPSAIDAVPDSVLAPLRDTLGRVSEYIEDLKKYERSRKKLPEDKLALDNQRAEISAMLAEIYGPDAAQFWTTVFIGKFPEISKGLSPTARMTRRVIGERALNDNSSGGPQLDRMRLAAGEKADD